MWMGAMSRSNAIFLADAMTLSGPPWEPPGIGEEFLSKCRYVSFGFRFPDQVRPLQAA